MKAKSLSSFAAGIVVATSIVATVYYLDSNTNAVSGTEDESKPSESEMKKSLTEAGYVIHTEEEWNEQIAEAEADTSDKQETDPEEIKETVIYRTMLTVSTGMTSIDVGDALVKANVIENAMDFFNEVEQRGLANKLRPGTYEVDSEMTVDEIISTIFK
ncbi:hypothetical protein [Litchfieldia salsa]|uniref:Aminodeoxychorismate lyase n=1 Tax=Litchfieldia salsa TaxID=930152 RepID=A0A1H0T822_9BACI|nr:hypothetical protein [Litchfieldia salsa]SDP49636.1 hypothetical protein SAMN05216565_103311 [Litchfieldia salsa]